MITDLFTVENGKVKPSLHCHLIPEFKQIIDKYEKRATDMLAYAFYYACPFKSINTSGLSGKTTKDFFKISSFSSSE
jgi:hypothetical protein